MKRIITFCTIFLMSITGVLSTPVICHGEEMKLIASETGQSDDPSDLIASEEERTTSVQVGEEGMVPVQGKDVKDGTYDIKVDSSSSMFRIVKAELTVKNGEMSAVLTLSGTGYLKLFMGTGEQAVAADESEYVPYAEDEDGAYTYTVAVPALDQELECTGFSKNKEKWYDHQILFRASSLPEEALLIELPDYGDSDEDEEEKEAPQANEKGVVVFGDSSEEKEAQAVPAQIDLKDGTYTIEVEMSGGTGRAEIASPAALTVKDKKAIAVIEWSSPNYDYMLVDGEKFLPVNTEGNSVFEIPVTVFDTEMKVMADTTAMSTPHEIEYSLIFHTDSIQGDHVESGVNGTVVVVVIVVIAVVVVAGVTVVLTKKKRKDSNA